MNKNYEVIIRTTPRDIPKEFEISAAKIIANHFKADVIFQRQQILKTPDLIVSNKIWELKSPIGDGKNTIHNNFKTARKQSKNIVIDLRRCKMQESKAYARIRETYLKRKRKTGDFLIITKNGKVIDISVIL